MKRLTKIKEMEEVFQNFCSVIDCGLMREKCFAQKIYDRLAELEDKLESGELVELPKDKWCIMQAGDKSHPVYVMVHQNPIAKFYGGKWHISMEEIDQWTKLIEKYDTKEQAEARLKKLQEKMK